MRLWAKKPQEDMRRKPEILKKMKEVRLKGFIETCKNNSVEKNDKRNYFVRSVCEL